MEPFIGEIKAVGWNFAARGFAMCNGQILGINQNTALFSLLGTVYGGNGQSTFQLPNLQGRVPIHQGQSPGTSLYSIGEVGGTETTTLTIAQMPMHNHPAPITVAANAITATAATTINGINRPSSRVAQPVGNLITSAVDGSGNALNMYAPASAGAIGALAPESASTTVTVAVAPNSLTATVGISGGSQPLGIVQPFVAVTYLIALTGIFPSRN